jgi:shikimate kinase
MGAGKTTVGRALARKTGFGFIDLDELIESQAGKSVTQIFAELGEDEFRRLEREALKSCAELDWMVISLGGGAYISEENRHIVKMTGISVLLDCPIEVCLSRVAYDGSRPLLKQESLVRDLYDKRLQYYRLADYTVGSKEDSPEEIADKIIVLLMNSGQ